MQSLDALVNSSVHQRSLKGYIQNLGLMHNPLLNKNNSINYTMFYQIRKDKKRRP
jgi:hypothetical protein